MHMKGLRCHTYLSNHRNKGKAGNLWNQWFQRKVVTLGAFLLMSLQEPVLWRVRDNDALTRLPEPGQGKAIGFPWKHGAPLIWRRAPWAHFPSTSAPRNLILELELIETNQCRGGSQYWGIFFGNFYSGLEFIQPVSYARLYAKYWEKREELGVRWVVP